MYNVMYIHYFDTSSRTARTGAPAGGGHLLIHFLLRGNLLILLLILINIFINNF